MNNLTLHPSDAQKLRELWPLFLTTGIALLLLGTMFLAFSLIFSVAVVLLFGLLLAAGAIIEIGSALWARYWHGFVLHVLLGTTYLIVAVILTDLPITSAVTLTLVAALGLMVCGLFRIILSRVRNAEHRRRGLLCGVVSIILGISLWRQWPLAGLWTIGLFIGFEMLISAYDWVWLGLAARKWYPSSN